MRKLLLAVIASAVSLWCSAQSVNERIAGAMNSGDWIALDTVYSAAPKDSIMPFLEVFSRALTGNRLNRPEVSIPAFAELLEKHSESLDLHNLLNSTVMFSMDLSKVGENAEAASVVASVLDATRQYLDSAAIDGMQGYVDRYTALADYKPYTLSFSERQGCIPFRIVPVGKPERETVLMHLADSRINGKDADITFDTGAGVNIISDSLALKYNLTPLNACQSVLGIGIKKGQMAIAKELKLGNIVVCDVPFVVVDLSLDNKEAERYIDCYSIVLGSELMLQLKDLTIDFVGRRISVPSAAPARSGAIANMYFSTQMNLVTEGEVHNEKMQICIDTGDASFGSLNGDFFRNNRDFVLANGRRDTVRTAGIGGVKILECYRLPEVAARIGGTEVMVPELIVNAGLNPLASEYECNMGLKSLMQFGKIRFNMVDFTITAYPAKLSALVPMKHTAPTFKPIKEKKPAFLQSAASVALSVANGLLNANAPTAPDL